MNFDRAFAFIQRFEGDYVNDPEDPGGETKFGISKKAYPDLDIRNLTTGEAKTIYLTDYWLKCRCDQIPQDLALMVFDTAVNQGPATAVRLLQKALQVVVDGVMGPVTIGAAFRSSPSLVIPEFIALRNQQYALNPAVHRFGLGWFRRSAACHQLALEP